MNSPLSRMLWKEFRSLRALWLGCVLGTFGLWGVIALAMLASSSPHTADDILFLVWTLALWLPAIYIIGCNAALYAGEREERTAEWLVSLAVPFRSFLTAKLLWPAASGALMQLVMVGAALLIQRSVAGLTTSGGSTVFDSFLPELPRLASFALIEALVWSWFWSLQFSRPLPAALASAGSLVAINLICGMLSMPTPMFSGSRGLVDITDVVLGPWGVLRVAFLFGLSIASGLLTRSWLSGQPSSWTIPWKRFMFRRKVRAVSLTIEPRTARQREWQRFRWLEWQSIRAFLRAIGMAAIGLTAVCLALSEPGEVKPALVWLILIGSHLPLLAGLAAWHGEQSNAQFRFFVNRGVSPLGLWLNKFSLWLAAVFLLIAVLAVLAGVSLYLSAIRLSEPGFQVTGQMLETLNQMTRGMPSFSRLAWSLATLYTGTFAVSLYFRRTIFAIGSGVLLYAGLIWWLVIVDVLRLPLWIGIVPVVAWLLWCSLRQLPRWALERTDWRSKGAIAAEWCVFPVLFAATVMAYWIYSVPAPDVAQIVTLPHGGSPFAPGTEATNWTPVREGIQRVLAKLSALQREMPPSQPAAHAMQTGQSEEVRLSEAQWFKIDDDVRELREALLSRIGMTPLTDFSEGLQRNSLSESQHAAVLSLLFQLAEIDLKAGKLQQSMHGARAAVRYVGALHVDAPLFPSMIRAQLHQNLHDSLLAWAEHPDNRPDNIAQLLKDIEQGELRWWMTDELSLHAEYEARAAERKRLLNEAGWRGVLFLPELARQRRLSATAISNLHRLLRSTAITQRNFAAFPPAEVRRESLLLPLSAADAAWSFRAQNHQYEQGRLIPANVPWGLTNVSITQLWDRETRIRCTCAALAAIAYRRANGTMPRSLADVTPEFATQTLLTDPWTGSLLRFESEGLPTLLNDNSGLGEAAPARTPFVWSAGPDLATIVKTDAQRIIYGTQTFCQTAPQPTRYVFLLPVKTFPDALLPENGAPDAPAQEPRTK